MFSSFLLDAGCWMQKCMQKFVGKNLPHSNVRNYIILLYMDACACVYVCIYETELLHLRQIKLHKYVKSEINCQSIHKRFYEPLKCEMPYKLWNQCKLCWCTEVSCTAPLCVSASKRKCKYIISMNLFKRNFYFNLYKYKHIYIYIHMYLCIKMQIYVNVSVFVGTSIKSEFNVLLNVWTVNW